MPRTSVQQPTALVPAAACASAPKPVSGRTTVVTVCALSLVLLWPGLSWALPSTGTAAPGVQATEEVLAPWYTGSISAISPDCRRVAIIDMRRVVRIGRVEWQPQMVIDGMSPSQRYQCTTGARFSPDGKRVMYIGGDGSKGPDVTGAHVVLDGTEGPRHFRIRAASCKFSPDSSHVAYVYEEGKQYRLVVDGEVKATYDEIGIPSWLPDSSGLVYAARRQGKWVAVSAAGEGPEHEEVSAVLPLDRAGTKVAYYARSGKKWHVVVDGAAGPEFDDLGSVVTRSTIAVPEEAAGPAAANGGGTNVVVAYEAKVGKGWVAMPRSGPEDTWQEVRLVGVSRDGAPHYAAKGGKKWRYVLGDWRGPEHDAVGVVRIGATNERTAYEARDGKEWRVVIGGQPGPAFQAVELVGGAYMGPAQYVGLQDGKLFWVKGTEQPVPIDVQSGCKYQRLLRFAVMDGAEVRGLAARIPQNRGAGSSMTEIVRLTVKP